MIIATSSPNKWMIGAEIIKWYQKTEFSHVLIIKDDLVFQASHGYVNCTHIDVFLETNKIIHCYEVPDEAVDFEFVKKQLGKKYSLKQLVNIACKYLFNIKLFSNNKDQQFICSEFVGKALRIEWVNDYTTPFQIDEYLKVQR